MRDRDEYVASFGSEGGDGIARRPPKMVKLVDLVEQNAVSSCYSKYEELDDGELHESQERMAGSDGYIDAGLFQRFG